MSRRVTREMTMKLFYQMEIGHEFECQKIYDYIEENAMKDMDVEYIKNISSKFIGGIEQVDEIIGKCSKRWSVKQISKIDLSILRLAVSEMMYADDINTGISINEAVELAKTYGGENSPSFINGVLGSAANELEK